jgi:hypothetical protein
MARLRALQSFSLYHHDALATPPAEQESGDAYLCRSVSLLFTKLLETRGKPIDPLPYEQVILIEQK